MNNLAINLRMLRDKNKLTQAEVSEKLHLGEKVLSNYENAKREPSSDLLLDLADFYGVTVDYLLRDNEDTKAYKNQLEKLLETYVRKQLPDAIENSELWKKYQLRCKEREQEWLEHRDDEEWIWMRCDEYKIENYIAMQDAEEKAMEYDFEGAFQDYEDLLISGNYSALRPLMTVLDKLEIIEDSYVYMNDELEYLENEMELIEKIITYCAIARKSISDELQSIYDCITPEVTG